MAFGEVLALNLTKCRAGNPQIVVVEGFSLASGEIFVLKVLSTNAQSLARIQLRRRHAYFEFNNSQRRRLTLSWQEHV